MKIITWNVNGIRASVKKGFLDKFKAFDTDVICLQETKAQDDQVKEALNAVEDYALFSNSAVRKGYSGTATLTNKDTINWSADIGIEEHDQEGRVLRTEFEAFNLVNVYVPNSGSGLKRLDYREIWDQAFTAYLEGLLAEKPLIVTGDFNVAFQDIDLARPKENYNKTSGYTQKEIDGFSNMLSIGLTDIWRKRNPEKQTYTFWNQRFKARERNVGWRIDYFLVSDSLVPKVKDVEILDQVMGSDHCPVSIDLEV